MSKLSYKQVVAVGLGGIWSYLWPFACRRMSYSRWCPKSLILVDRDQFSPSNLERQDMRVEDTMKPKAEVYRERIKNQFPALKTKAIHQFVTAKNVARIVPDNSIVLSCLDNFAARRVLADHARSLKNVVLISGANEEKVGNAHLHLVMKKPLTKGMDEAHEGEDGWDDKDNPGEMSCEERARLPSGGQTALANFFAAACMGIYFEAFSRGGEINKDELKRLVTKSENFFDLEKMVMGPTSRAL